MIWIQHKYSNKYRNKRLTPKTFSHFLELCWMIVLSKLLKLSGTVMLYNACVKSQLKNMELFWSFWFHQGEEINTLFECRKYLPVIEINFYRIYSGHFCFWWLNFCYVKTLHENWNVLSSSRTSFIFQLSVWGHIIGSEIFYG